jgi:hypothetical protein
MLPVSRNSGSAGMVPCGQIVHGHAAGSGAGGAVVNAHDTDAASGLPLRSLTRGSAPPPRTVAL